MPLRQEGLVLFGHSLELFLISITRRGSLLHLRAGGVQEGVERDLGGRNPHWTQEGSCLVLCYRKKLWHERCMGGAASPSSAGNSIWLYLQHTLPPALGAWQCGDTRGLPLQERAVPSKGSLCLSLLGVLGISLCGLSKHERVIWFCQDRQSCSGLCQEDELSANSRQGVLQLSPEPLGLALVVRRLWPARSGVDEVLHT